MAYISPTIRHGLTSKVPASSGAEICQVKATGAMEAMTKEQFQKLMAEAKDKIRGREGGVIDKVCNALMSILPGQSSNAKMKAAIKGLQPIEIKEQAGEDKKLQPTQKPAMA